MTSPRSIASILALLASALAVVGCSKDLSASIPVPGASAPADASAGAASDPASAASN